jgi:hypothetical protein
MRLDDWLQAHIYTFCIVLFVGQTRPEQTHMQIKLRKKSQVPVNVC